MVVRAAMVPPSPPATRRPAYRATLDELVALAKECARAESRWLFAVGPRRAAEARVRVLAAREALEHKARQIEAVLVGLRDLVERRNPALDEALNSGDGSYKP